jgi:hypothetical protein
MLERKIDGLKIVPIEAQYSFERKGEERRNQA